MIFLNTHKKVGGIHIALFYGRTTWNSNHGEVFIKSKRIIFKHKWELTENTTHTSYGKIDRKIALLRDANYTMWTRSCVYYKGMHFLLNVHVWGGILRGRSLKLKMICREEDGRSGIEKHMVTSFVTWCGSSFQENMLDCCQLSFVPQHINENIAHHKYM